MAAGTPSTDWQERVAPDEEERFERYAAYLGELQRKNALAGRRQRALHAKPQLGARAELTVLPDLPAHARVGLFSAPATYPAWVRFSNGSSRHQADQRPDVRGLAIKVVGVPGRKLIPGLEDAKTQDFLLIQSPSTPFRDADEFVAFVRAATNPLLLLPRLIGRFGPLGALRLLRRLAAGVSAKIPTLAGKRYFSALPIKYGPYAVHYALRPVGEVAPPLAQQASADYLGEELAARLSRGPVEYDFLVQFYVDPVKTPIEDASVEWREEDAPPLKVARLTLPQQDLRSPEGQKVRAFIDSLSFDPWHATEDFRPLGDMMRARKHAYRVSVLAREAAREPDGSERFG